MNSTWKLYLNQEVLSIPLLAMFWFPWCCCSELACPCGNTTCGAVIQVLAWWSVKLWNESSSCTCVRPLSSPLSLCHVAGKMPSWAVTCTNSCRASQWEECPVLSIWWGAVVPVPSPLGRQLPSVTWDGLRRLFSSCLISHRMDLPQEHECLWYKQGIIFSQRLHLL